MSMVRGESANRRGDYGAAVVSTFVGQIGFTTAAFGGTVLTARLLGPSGRGELALLILVPTLGAVALEFGQEFAVSHIVAARQRLAGKLAANLAAFAISVSLVTAMASTTLLHWLRATREYPWWLGIAIGVAVGMGVLNRGLAGLVVGTGLIRRYNYARLLQASGLLVGATVLTATSVRSSHYYFLGWLAGLGAAVVALWLSLPDRRIRVSSRVARYQLRLGAGIHSGNLAQFLLLRVDQLLLGAFSGAAAVGVYSVAVNLAEVVWYLPAAAGLVAIPRLSAPHLSRREQDEILRLALRGGVLAPFVLAIGAAVAAPFLIPSVFGNAFVASVWPLEWLLPGVFAASLTRICQAVLIARGDAHRIWRSATVALLLNLSANALLIPRFGASGAAAASSFSYVVFAAFLIRAATRSLKTSAKEWLKLAMFAPAAAKS